MLISRARAGGGALLLEQRVDLGVGDADAARDLALAHPLDQHLVAHVVAEARVVDAFAPQALAQLRQRQLVLRRDAARPRGRARPRRRAMPLSRA